MDISVNANVGRITAYTRTQVMLNQSNTEERTASAVQTSSRTQDEVVISAEARAAIASGATETANEQRKVADGSGETTFTSTAEQSIEMNRQLQEIVDAYYSKQHEENLSFSNPQLHIQDKYMNENSPYFRSDMTADERRIAYGNEMCMLSTGSISGLSYGDYALRGRVECASISTQEVIVNQRTRDQIESTIANILKENGIPEDISFKLTVNPYDHYISVLGLEDEATTNLIEQMLNQGNNGRNLYYHIQSCNPEKFGVASEQHSAIDKMKSSLYHMVMNDTGYHIWDLESDGETIWLPDGRDLWEVMEQCAATRSNGNDGFGVDISNHRAAYDQIAKYGWQDDPGLSLEYKNGSLYDMSDEYGYGDGQNAWTEDVFANPQKYGAIMMEWVADQAIDLQVQREDDED